MKSVTFIQKLKTKYATQASQKSLQASPASHLQ